MGDGPAEIYQRLFNFWLVALAVIVALKLWGSAGNFITPPELAGASAPVPAPDPAVTLPDRIVPVEQTSEPDSGGGAVHATASGADHAEREAEPPGSATEQSGSESSELIDRLNRSTAKDFQQVSGIGPVISERIVERREAMDGFSSTDDLRLVRGVGEQRARDIIDWLEQNGTAE